MRDGKLARRDAFLMQDAEGESDRADADQLRQAVLRQRYGRPGRAGAARTSSTRPTAIAEWLRQATRARGRLTVAAARREAADGGAGGKNAATRWSSRRRSGLADSEKTGEARCELQEAAAACRGTPRRDRVLRHLAVQGTNQVASMVVFEDGRRSARTTGGSRSRRGRHQRLPHMQEVVRRRFTRALADQGLAERVADDDVFDEQPTEAGWG